MEPAAPQNSQARCLAALREVPARNPFSGEGRAINEHHRRIPLVAGPRLRDIRDALTLRAPLTVRWKGLTSPAAPRLRFAYALGKCSGWRSDRVVAHIAVHREGKTVWSRDVALVRPPRAKPGTTHAPWLDVEVPLELSEGAAFDLELRLSAPPRSDPVVSLAEVQLVGRPRLTTPLHDRNVLLIIVDALRSDLVGPARRKDLPQLAPNIDAFMARGTSFARAYSVSNQTRHSTLAMFTSQTPTMGRFFTRGWITRGPLADRWYASKPPLITLDLASAGWATSTIGHNRFLFGHHAWGMDHGFDRIWNNGHRTSRDTPQLVDQAIAYLERHRDERFFLYFNLVTPHLPHRPPQRYLDETQALLGGRSTGLPGDMTLGYLGEIRYLDAEFGRFVRAFDRLGLGRDTLVAFTADHGELFKRAHACRSSKMRNVCRKNHGVTLYNEEIHVPLSFIGDSIEPGRVVAEPFSQMDLAPTLLELTGLPENVAHAGTSWAGVLTGQGARASARPVYAESRQVVALIDGHDKLMVHNRWSRIFTPARTGMKRPPSLKRRDKEAGERVKPRWGQYELFDLNTDPEETLNLAPKGESTAKVKAMLETLSSVRLGFAERMSRFPPDALRTPRGTGAGAVPPTRARPPAPAFNVLLLRAGGASRRATGKVSVANGATILCGHIRGKATCKQLDQAVEVTLEATTDPAGLAFETRPWDAALTFSLTLDDKPFEVSRLRLGPFGISMGGEPAEAPLELLRRAQARYPPRLSRTGEVGLFFWRSLEPVEAPVKSGQTVPTATLSAPKQVPLGPEAIDAPSTEAMDKGMRKALKELGYTR